MTETTVPSLADLALQYGTIDKGQYQKITALHASNAKKNSPQDYETILINQGLATGYQIGLLTLIREFYIIRKKGETFGKIVIEKGFATQEEVDKALEFQRKEFQRAKVKKLIGDILVETEVITEKQKNSILKEQSFIEQQAEEIISKKEPPEKPPKKEVQLSEYEEQFLKIKALDLEFAAAVVEKKFAVQKDVKSAQDAQAESFEKNNVINNLGTIMVKMNTLSVDQMNIVLEEQERHEEAAAAKALFKEQNLVLSISEDNMEARVKIAEKPTEPITLAMIKQSLEDQKVTSGIYPDAIIEVHLQEGDKEFTVAYQDGSEELIKAKHTAFIGGTKQGKTTQAKKGDIIVEEEVTTPAYDKTDIFGKTRSTQDPGKDFTFRSGPGTKITEKGAKIVAVKSGALFVSIARKLYINPTVHVLEDMDFRYGASPEPYAQLHISGILTGAFPVTAGMIKAIEIRGATIKVLGDIHVDVGITDSTIESHGNIRARYIHNCNIQTFGNIHVQNEIYDSTIYSAGKVDSDQCRVISSKVYAKQGIVLAGAGSQTTGACTLCAGSEHALLAYNRIRSGEIDELMQEVNELEKQKEDLTFGSKKIFQKMIELKMFHDHAKEKQQLLVKEFNAKKEQINKENKKNLISLIKNFEKRMGESVKSIKEYNLEKKKCDLEIKKLESQIALLKKNNEKKILTLEQDIYSFYEWARSQKSNCEIKILKKIFQGTVLKSTYAEKKTKTDIEKFCATEVRDKGAAQIKITPS